MRTWWLTEHVTIEGLLAVIILITFLMTCPFVLIYKPRTAGVKRYICGKPQDDTEVRFPLLDQLI